MKLCLQATVFVFAHKTYIKVRVPGNYAQLFSTPTRVLHRWKLILKKLLLKEGRKQFLKLESNQKQSDANNSLFKRAFREFLDQNEILIPWDFLSFGRSSWALLLSSRKKDKRRKIRNQTLNLFDLCLSSIIEQRQFTFVSQSLARKSISEIQRAYKINHPLPGKINFYCFWTLRLHQVISYE